jgi:hypothetical protein
VHPAMLRVLALLLLVAAPPAAGAKPGKAKPDGAPPAAAAASQAPASGQGWTPVLRQKQKQCRAQNRCSLDPRAPACQPCRGI